MKFDQGKPRAIPSRPIIEHAAASAKGGAIPNSGPGHRPECSELVECPPMQAGASFNIGDLKAKIEQAIAASKAQGD